MEVRRFRAEDLHALSLQNAQMFMRPTFDDPDYARGLADTRYGESWTAEQDGRILACLGVQNPWRHRQQAWGLLADGIKAHFLPLHLQVKRWLRYHGSRRIEAVVCCNFPQAIRWAELLGFTLEGTMHKYDPEGRDCYLYAKVK